MRKLVASRMPLRGNGLSRTAQIAAQLEGEVESCFRILFRFGFLGLP
jgi:hypothetical protein